MYSRAHLGGWVRNIHYWSANLIVVAGVLHLLRVVMTGAVGSGRRLNWVLGLVLFALILAANFSGYLLPWDQLAFWAVTICTSMMSYIPGIGPWLMELFRGGAEVGPDTLTNFFGLHIAVIPGLILIFMIWHFWLVRKSGGLVRAEKEPGTTRSRVPAVPDLVAREAAAGCTVIALVMLLAAFQDAPLYDKANPGMSPNPTKAPWYFLGFQELLLHLHPTFAIVVVPLVTAVLLFAFPFMKECVLPGGSWFGGKKGRVLALWTFAVGTLLTALAIVLDEQLLRMGQSPAGGTDIFTRGYLFLLGLTALLAAGYHFLIRMRQHSRAEAVMALVIFSFAVLTILTVTGVWFRGPGMQLIWFH